MTYRTEIRDGHHYVDMNPKTSPPLRIIFNEDFVKNARDSLNRIGGAFKNLGLLTRDVMALKGYTTRIQDGHHYVTIQQPDGGDRMPKQPQETVHREDQPKRVSKEKDKPVRVHPGRDNK